MGAPDSLLALAKDRRREPRRYNNDDYQSDVKRDIRTSLYPAITWQSGSGRKHGADDGSVESLVVSQSNEFVEFRAALHVVEQGLHAAVAGKRGIESLLCLVGDAQGRDRLDHHAVAHGFEFRRR